MCCDACPKYEDCSLNDKLKENCCNACPDYETCCGDGGDDDKLED